MTAHLGEVLQRLEAWGELQALAENSLQLHFTYGTPSQLAQDYGFLAEVALQQSRWSQARQLAELALAILPCPSAPLFPCSPTLLFTLYGHADSVMSVSFSPDSEIIASASKDKTVKLWTRNGKLIKTLTGHKGWVTGLKQ